MKIAITGGTGFVGGHLARALHGAGHGVRIVARGADRRDLAVRALPGVTFHPVGTGDEERLAAAFAGCAVVVHCAGINRERGEQSYRQVHVEGTRCVIAAVRRAGVRKLVYVSFLRARPSCGSGYHESKFAAEELVRGSHLAYTILKPGVIYGPGDHMLDHLSHAFHTFPVFALVGFRRKQVAPLAVEDFVRVLQAAVDDRLSGQTVSVVGPEQMSLTEAVRRVARAVGRRPAMFPLPLWFHYALAWICEQTMTTPLVSIGQVRILSEGVVEPAPMVDELPDDLKPTRAFSEAQILAGLPPANAFGLGDCRWFQARPERLGAP